MKVNEIFGPTIQGEGKTAGQTVTFLRLSGCDLACLWCDTPYTWNWIGTRFQHPEKYEREQEVHEMTIDEVFHQIETLSQIRHLVISGGEPLLQQDELILLLRVLKERKYFVEVETNGTIVLADEFLQLVDQINCSPKLSNSGMDNRPKMRERPKALRKLAQSEKVYFKFVVTSEQDIEEILSLVQRYRLENVYLMPEGRTKEEQEENQKRVYELARAHGFEFSSRLHVLRWGNQRGV